jgi:uncharacterized protein
MILRANGFDWDKGNRSKCEKHGLSVAAIEGLLIAHSPFSRMQPIRRANTVFEQLAEPKRGEAYFIVFTLSRKGEEVLIRPISARYMHKKEIEAYEEENPDL